jgi:hypothetical protein
MIQVIVFAVGVADAEDVRPTFVFVDDVLDKGLVVHAAVPMGNDVGELSPAQ